MGEQVDELDYVIKTVEVKTDLVQRLDTRNTMRDKDGTTVKMPGVTNPCQIQLWEIYIVVSILAMQPPSTMLMAHIKALLHHKDTKYYCESVLKEHVHHGNIQDSSNVYSFWEEYFLRKFEIQFPKQELQKYVKQSLEDKLCGRGHIPRKFLMSPFVQAMLLNASFFEGQYDELLEGLRSAKLPFSDILAEDEEEMGDSAAVKWDNVKLYDDPTLILKKHGGWAMAKSEAERQLTPKDQLLLRLTGVTLEELLAGTKLPDSPRDDGESRHVTPRLDPGGQGTLKQKRLSLTGGDHEAQMTEQMRRDSKKNRIGLKTIDEDDGDRRPSIDDQDSESEAESDYEIDPEHPKIMPLGVTLSEAYLLIRGLLTATKHPRLKADVLGESVTAKCRDRNALAAAVLLDLYMREQIEVSHWTLAEGNIAAVYKIEKRGGQPLMQHFLDFYTHYVDDIFRDMKLPSRINEWPIWQNLEQRGILENHRYVGLGGGCLAKGIGYDAWDLARPDWLLDLKRGYLESARVLYDPNLTDPMNEVKNDTLMFVYLIQELFDFSFEAIDGLSRVLRAWVAPFEKGELFPPVEMVHAGSVCKGIIDRAFRVATGLDTQLAQEAAMYNQDILERLELAFFLSPAVWLAFDDDDSGEISLDEFVDGMKKLDLYKDFRKERIPEDVLSNIVGDLAEKLFREVDVNGDGTLSADELHGAFSRRRKEAIQEAEKRKIMKKMAISFLSKAGIKIQKKDTTSKAAVRRAEEIQEFQVKKAQEGERQRRAEWSSTMDQPQMQDEDVDVDAVLVASR